MNNISQNDKNIFLILSIYQYKHIDIIIKAIKIKFLYKIQVLRIVNMPRVKTTTPATLFIHQIFLSLNLSRKTFTIKLNTNHHEVAPDNTPVTKLISPNGLFSVPTMCIPANIAKKTKRAIGLVIVRKKNAKEIM